MSLKHETAAFLESVLEEAASDSGTWSLTTYTGFRGRVATMAPCEGKVVFDAFFSVILDDTAKPVTRYKLSQLCSAAHTFKIPHCEDVFREYAPSIREMLDRLDQAQPLSRPMAHLLTSLLTEIIIQPNSGPEHGRRLSHGAVRLCGRRVPRHAMARTPQPNSGPGPDE
jgi:hypothetical protein